VTPIPLRWRILLPLLRRLPQGILSRGTGWLAERRIPRPLRSPVIGGFARVVGADLAEAEGSPTDYASVSQFFTRRLQSGARTWPDDSLLPASPVDGVVGALGRLEEGTLIQAKGKEYSARELLGGAPPSRWGADPAPGVTEPGTATPGATQSGAGSSEAAVSALDERGVSAFQEGAYLTLYLSPRHYHRIHAPVEGALTWARSIPGNLLPVNEPAVASIPELFARNERLVGLIQGRAMGPVAVVAVGAFNVGRISAAFDEGWNGPDGLGVTNRRKRRQVEERVYDPPVPVARGEELMAFHLGSTVVLLFQGEERAFHPKLTPGVEVKMGQPLFGSGA